MTTFHGVYQARSPLKRFYNSVMARGDVVIANSEYTRQHILDTYTVDPERVVTIPRGVDLNAFDRSKVSDADVDAMRTLWRVGRGDARCVMIVPARLTRWKGQITLIEAVDLIEKRRPGALKVIIAGDAQGRDAYVDEMKAAITRASLQDVVVIAGHIVQMPTAFAASDIAVFPVIEPEAFGRGAIEAQAMGVPVIASNLGGFTETVVEGETGFLAPPNTAQALAGVIERMIDLSPAERAQMGAQGRARVSTLYSKSALQSATLAVYRRVLSEAASRGAAKSERAPIL